MGKILGYGEDALTLWAMRNCITDVLRRFRDETPPSDCVIFYRPSFGRSGGSKSTEFGEFDAIVASSKNVYLIESKWDNLANAENRRIVLKKEQKLRHELFAWYLTHWSKKYSSNWRKFIEEQEDNFKTSFKDRKKGIPKTDSILAVNLQYVLKILQSRCKSLSKQNVKNVLVFFSKEKTRPSVKPDPSFHIINISYGGDVAGNFITLG